MSSIDVRHEYPKLAAAVREAAALLRAAMKADRVDRVHLHFDGGTDISVELDFEPRDEYGVLDLRAPEEAAAEREDANLEAAPTQEHGTGCSCTPCIGDRVAAEEARPLAI